MDTVNDARLRAIGGAWAHVARLAGRLRAREHAEREREIDASGRGDMTAADRHFYASLAFGSSAVSAHYCARDLRWADRLAGVA